MLDLDDLGAEPAEDLRAGRPGERRGQVDDANPVQRLEAHAPEATHRIASEDAYSRAAKPGGTMKLGMNMLLWSTDVTGPGVRLPVSSSCATLGYDGIEVPIFDTSPAARKLRAAWRAARRASAWRRSASVRARATTARSAPIRRSARARAAGDERRRRHLRRARRDDDLRPAGGAARRTSRGTGPTDEERQRAVECLRAAAEHAATRDVTIVVEYLNRFEMYLIELRRRRSRARARGRPPATAG